MAKLKLKKLIESFQEEQEFDTEGFLESVKNYSSYGKAIYREHDLAELAGKLSEIAKNAGFHAVKETEESFDKITVSRNMKELKSYSDQFNKVASEAHTLQQRMEGLYEDMGKVLGRYYEINELDEGGKGSGRKAKPGGAKDIENKAMSAADAANAKMDAAEKAMKKKKKKKNEGKLTEGWKPIAKKNVKYKDKTGTYNWEIESGIDTDSHVGKNLEKGVVPKIILHYQHEDETGYPSSGGNTFWLKHKNDTPYTPQEAKALVNKISNKKIGEFHRKSRFPNGSGQNVFYVDGKFIREGTLKEGGREIAKTILQQLGGNKFIAMTGAKNLGHTNKGLQMKIGRNSKSITHVIINLKSSDLYEMEFIRMRGTSRTVVKKVSGVYNDMLGKIFTKYTGLRVRL